MSFCSYRVGRSVPLLRSGTRLRDTVVISNASCTAAPLKVYRVSVSMFVFLHVVPESWYAKSGYAEDSPRTKSRRRLAAAPLRRVVLHLRFETTSYCWDCCIR